MAFLVGVGVSALLLPGSTPSLALPVYCSPPRRRVAASPRCADAGPPADTSFPLGGELDDDSILTSGAANQWDVEFVRPPPEYPEGLHEAAKADRTGPFWSSLGEPDVSTGVRPSYLCRDDWHVSSTYTAEERSAVTAAEQEYIESVIVETPMEDEEEVDPFEEKEYMTLEHGPPASGATASTYAMPASWQDYQALEADLESLASSEALGDADRAEAAVHAQALKDFYVTFKDILAGGWALLNNREVEAAIKFKLAHQAEGTEERMKWERPDERV